MQLTPETRKKLGLALPSKYGNVKAWCLLRHKHDSTAEAMHCNSLLADQQAGRVAWFKVQVPFTLRAGIVHIVDFLVNPTVEYAPGQRLWSAREEVHDVKGCQTAVWRMKYKMFCEKYPDIKYVIVNRKEKRDGRTTTAVAALLARRSRRS